MQNRPQVGTCATYGYLRSLVGDPTTARQLSTLRAAGVKNRYIYMDIQTGQNSDHPALKRLLSRLKPGDVLYLTSLDQLGRDYRAIAQRWEQITQRHRADVVVLDMPLLDTRMRRDSVGTVILDVVTQLLHYVARQERAYSRQQQRHGIAQAQARGVRFERKAQKRPEKYEEYAKAWRNGKISIRQAAQELGVAHTTLYRWIKDSEKKKSF